MSPRTINFGQRRRMDPFRVPQWRWPAAGQIARGEGRPAKTDDDPALFAAVRVRKQMKLGKSPKASDKLSRAILDALRIFEADDLLRSEIEARLLAGETNEEVSQGTGIEPEVIEAYEKTFFDVRDFLGAYSYLRTHTVGDRVSTGFGEEDLREFWAMIAIDGGAPVLDAILNVFRKVYQPGERATLAVYLREPVPVALQGFVAGLLLPWDLSMWRDFGSNYSSEMLLVPYDGKSVPAEIRDHIIRAAKAHLAGQPIPPSDKIVQSVEKRTHEREDTPLSNPACDSELIEPTSGEQKRVKEES